jgi:hypothetical protein
LFTLFAQLLSRKITQKGLKGRKFTVHCSAQQRADLLSHLAHCLVRHFAINLTFLKVAIA